MCKSSNNCCMCRPLSPFSRLVVPWTQRVLNILYGKAALWGFRKGFRCVMIPIDHLWDILPCSQLINIRPRSITTYEHRLQRAEEPIVARKVGQGLPCYSQLFLPYRVSCPDQQGQTDPLITETADENESKMRPITTRAWLISLCRPLHTHWTHARSSHAHTSYTCT